MPLFIFAYFLIEALAFFGVAKLIGVGWALLATFALMFLGGALASLALLAVPLLIIIRTVISAAGKPDIAGFLFEHGTLMRPLREEPPVRPPASPPPSRTCSLKPPALASPGTG